MEPELDWDMSVSYFLLVTFSWESSMACWLNPHIVMGHTSHSSSCRRSSSAFRGYKHYMCWLPALFCQVGILPLLNLVFLVFSHWKPVFISMNFNLCFFFFSWSNYESFAKSKNNNNNKNILLTFYGHGFWFPGVTHRLLSFLSCVSRNDGSFLSQLTSSRSEAIGWKGSLSPLNYFDTFV